MRVSRVTSHGGVMLGAHFSGVLALLMHLQFMAGETTDSGASQGMMVRHVAGDAADNRPGETTHGAGRAGDAAGGQREAGGEDNDSFHLEIPRFAQSGQEANLEAPLAPPG